MTCKAPLDIYIEVHAVCARRQEYLNLCFPRCNGDMGHQGASRASDKVDRFYSLSNMNFVYCKKFRDFHSRAQVQAGLKHTSYLSRTRGRCLCKFFLAGVNLYRFNAKNWQFTVYFAVITQKTGNLLCILS